MKVESCFFKFPTIGGFRILQIRQMQVNQAQNADEAECEIAYFNTVQIFCTFHTEKKFVQRKWQGVIKTCSCLFFIAFPRSKGGSVLNLDVGQVYLSDLFFQPFLCCYN